VNAAGSPATPQQPARSTSHVDRLIALWTVGALAFLVMALFARFYDRFPGDEWLTDVFQSVDVPVLGGYLDFVNILGETWVRAGLAVCIAALVAFRGAGVEGVLVLFALLPNLLNNMIKGWVERPRPSDELVDVHKIIDGYSFPSGHTVGTTVLMLAVFVVVPTVVKWKAARWLIQLVCLLFIASAGPARVYVGVHWPSDVVGGYVLALLLAGPVICVYRQYVRSAPAKGTGNP
jgi:undecaprenyl-diphosphatase